MRKTIYLFLIIISVSCQQKNKNREITISTEKLDSKEISQTDYVEEIKPHPINCFDLPSILEKVRDWDSKNRIDEIIEHIDRKNLEIVVSIIENCGMPTSKTLDKKHISTIFLVLQHGDNYHRKKYFPLIKEAVEKGDLHKSDYALMMDRILISEGKPQLYGTQSFYNEETNELELFPIYQPELLEKRIAELGWE